MKTDFALSLDFYELTMAEVYFKYKRNSYATFDLFIRALPAQRSYLLACGLEDILDFVRNLRFDWQALAYLRSQGKFSKAFLDYLKNFKFHGDIWAMPEGQIFFANEPVLRVTARIIEAQILESFLLNSVNLETMIASKASRVVTAAAGRALYDFSLRRTHGAMAGLKVARCAYLAGFQGSSNVLAGMRYAIPLAGTMAHSFVMAFKKERESFSTYSRTFPANTILLIDTYDSKKGINNAVQIGLEMKQGGNNLFGIRLDSGDLLALSRFARKELDRVGLKKVKIFASGNLDEHIIARLVKNNAAIDSFGVGTKMGTSADSPYLDVIYKLSQISEDGSRFLPTMKLSRGKNTYPGRKQVFRIKDKKGFYLRDILGLEGERIKGEPLLAKVVSKGKVIYKSPALKKMRAFVEKNLAVLPRRYKELSLKARYPVVISPALKKLIYSLSQDLKQRQ